MEKLLWKIYGLNFFFQLHFYCICYTNLYLLYKLYFILDIKQTKYKDEYVCIASPKSRRYEIELHVFLINFHNLRIEFWASAWIVTWFIFCFFKEFTNYHNTTFPLFILFIKNNHKQTVMNNCPKSFALSCYVLMKFVILFWCCFFFIFVVEQCEKAV